MVSGSEFKDFPYLLTCFFSLSTPPPMLSIWGREEKSFCPNYPYQFCGGFTISAAMRRLYLVLSRTKMDRGLMWPLIAPLCNRQKWDFFFSLLCFSAISFDLFWAGVFTSPIFSWNCQVLVFLNWDGHCVPSWHWKEWIVITKTISNVIYL